MTAIQLKEQLIVNIKKMPVDYLYEVADFIEFLKLHEDKWFIDYVNKTTRQVIRNKKKKLYSLRELQQEFKK